MDVSQQIYKKMKPNNMKCLTRGMMIVAFTFALKGLMAQPGMPDPMPVDAAMMAAAKTAISKGDPVYKAALGMLVKRADASLTFKPVSVMDKKDVPPSGDKHDFMSLAPYWWPDPAKPNGMPYIRKDGVVNPEVKNYPDKEQMPKLCENVYWLSLAWHFTGKDAYAVHAARLLRTWFLDTATRMNPNMKYGQAVKGVTEGRAEGLIETRHFLFALEGVHLLKGSKHWTDADQAGMQAWIRSFLDWMQSHPIGIDERNARNNHGIWYEAQRLGYAQFVGDKSLAASVLRDAQARLNKEQTSDGSFPLELARTTSMGYSVFVMHAFSVIAELSRRSGDDFWMYEGPKGASMRRGMDFLIPYLSGSAAWKHEQIKPFQPETAFALLWSSSRRQGCKDCLDVLEKETNGTFAKSPAVLY
jgi:hypothetical protein